MPEYILYSKSHCVWCDRIKDLLRSRSITYSEVRVDANLENLEEFKAKAPGVKTVPQLFEDGKRIGGFIETQMYFNDVYGGAFGDNI